MGCCGWWRRELGCAWNFFYEDGYLDVAALLVLLVAGVIVYEHSVGVFLDVDEAVQQRNPRGPSATSVASSAAGGMRGRV